ncbi:MAG: Zn-dependent hydrolase [Burkholderiales bacterium]|jgi:N-carbamoyl-L-amino-acid hydrolase|nr:Zn-dependent hydrolase [Burkholderiales bacterium]
MNDRPPQAAHITLSIDGARLWQSLHDLARIGATAKGGVCRLALSELDAQARRRVIDWAGQAGCSVRVDAIGNIFARRAGSDPQALPVATGSHIDTQPNGGKFDGNYGVLAGLEVVRTLNDAGIRTRAPLELCIWTNEEGSRFAPVMMGSGVYCGAFTLDHALAARDRDGVSVAEALAASGFAGDVPAAVADGAQRFAAYFEAHIEQGPVLEGAGCTIGVVSGALGQRWFDVTVAGQEAHAGPTPMPLRRDALYTAAQLMQQVVEIARQRAPDGRGTVGYVDVFPNSRNVIPGRVKFSVDFRHPDDAGLAAMEAALRAAVERIAADGKVRIEVQQVVYFPPTPFDAELQESIRAAALARGHSQMALPSGAGHDAIYVARTAPAAMIFVPCKDGISHNEIEDAKPEDLAAGANVLLDAMLARAGIA